jgi:hypothetical protein
MDLQPGQIVRVRSRKYLVEGVAPPPAPADSPLVRLSCVEDDAPGEQLEVLWDTEVDAQVVDSTNWQAIASRGFDEPRLFSAYLNTLRWHCVIVTAADPKAIPEQMRTRLEVIELSGYTEQEKLHIAEQYLLKRAFEVTMPVSAGCLALESAASSSIVAPDTDPAAAIVVAEREVSSMAELEALSAGPPFPAADAWRMGASEGAVRFEPEAIR